MEETQDARWRRMADQIQQYHPNGAAAVQTAAEAGLNPDDFSGGVFEGPALATGPYPVLYFGDWSAGGAYHMVQPGYVGIYTPIPRGQGPELIKGGRS